MQQLLDFTAQHHWYIAGAAFLIILLAAVYMVIRTRKLCKPLLEEKYRLELPDKAAASRVARSLSGAIQIKTTASEGEQAILKFHKYLETQYPLVHKNMKKTVVNGSLLYFLKGSNQEKQPIMFCAHMDTVEAEGNWKHSPFAGEIIDGYVYGRGAIDCKNTVVSLMQAMETLFEKGFKANRDIYLAFGHDEEVGGTQGAQKMCEMLRKQGVKPELVLDEGGHIALDFLDRKNCICAVVNVAEKGIANIRLTANDKGGHAAYPPKHTGLGRLCEAVCQIEASPMKRCMLPLTEEYFVRIAPALKWKYRFYLANRRLFKGMFLKDVCKNPHMRALFTNTMAATQAWGSAAPNILPQDASCVLNCRILPGFSSQDVFEHIKRITEPMGVKAELLYSCEPSNSDTFKSPMLTEIEETLRKRFGKQILVTPGLMAASSDAKYYEDISGNVIRFMPLLLKPKHAARMHGADECVSVNALGAAVEWYIDFIEKLSR